MIELSHIHRDFQVGDQRVHALDDVSLEVPNGKVMVVIGPSGSGKSTLVNLLLRFWEYNTGSIQLDGQELRRYVQEDVQACFAVVPPDPYFFNTTIEENLRLAQAGGRVSDALRVGNIAELRRGNIDGVLVYREKANP